MKTASHIVEETVYGFGCEFRKKQNRGLVDETRTALKGPDVNTQDHSKRYSKVLCFSQLILQ